MLLFVAALSWVVPAGQYNRVMNEQLGKEVPVPGTYHSVPPDPQRLRDVVMAPIAGMYDPTTEKARAIDVALFVLIIGGFLGVVTKTGAIDAGIGRVTAALKGREIWMIPILMALFALGGTTYGMAEESLAFYALIIPVILAAGYDAVTAVAVIMLGAGIGTLGSTINPFATVIASNAAQIPFTQGMDLRLAILGLGWLACVIYVMRYARRVKADPSKSLVADQKRENEEHFLKGKQGVADRRTDGDALDRARHLRADLRDHDLGRVLGGLVDGADVGAVPRRGHPRRAGCAHGREGTDQHLRRRRARPARRGADHRRGARRRGADGRGQDHRHVLEYSSHSVRHLSAVAFINVTYWVEILLSFFVPSSSGLAVLSMPIMAPLADVAGASRHLVVTAFQSANGIVNLVNPTFAVVMGGLAIGRVGYDRWLRFMGPLLVILTRDHHGAC